jgi:hypothetical protein
MQTATMLRAPVDAVPAAVATARLRPACYTPVAEWRRACAMAALVRAVADAAVEREVQS